MQELKESYILKVVDIACGNIFYHTTCLLLFETGHLEAFPEALSNCIMFDTQLLLIMLKLSVINLLLYVTPDVLGASRQRPGASKIVAASFGNLRLMVLSERVGSITLSLFT